MLCSTAFPMLTRQISDLNAAYTRAAHSRLRSKCVNWVLPISPKRRALPSLWPLSPLRRSYKLNLSTCGSPSSSHSSGTRHLLPALYPSQSHAVDDQSRLGAFEAVSDSSQYDRPYWEDVREYEKHLPQHNLSLPYPEGRTGRYLHFDLQSEGVGWGNVITEM
jgi:hypothetical protein